MTPSGHRRNLQPKVVLQLQWCRTGDSLYKFGRTDTAVFGINANMLFSDQPYLFAHLLQILADLDNGIVNLMYAIGLHCNGICRSFAQLYSAIDIPVIGTGCNSKELQDKSRESGFPYFARVIGSSEGLTVARHDFLSSHSLWTRIKILTLNDPDRLEAADQLKQYFRTANIKQTNQVSVDLQKLPKSCGEEPTIPLKEKAVYKDIKNILKAARTAYNSKM